MSMGRATIYSKKLLSDAKKLAKLGLNDKSIYQALDISHETFYVWMREKAEFSDAIKKARAIGKKTLLNRVYRAGAKQWQAAAWALERQYPNEFGKDIVINIKTIQTQLEPFVDRLIKVINEYIKDDATREAIFTELRQTAGQDGAGAGRPH